MMSNGQKIQSSGQQVASNSHQNSSERVYRTAGQTKVQGGGAGETYSYSRTVEYESKWFLVILLIEKDEVSSYHCLNHSSLFVVVVTKSLFICYLSSSVEEPNTLLIWYVPPFSKSFFDLFHSRTHLHLNMQIIIRESYRAYPNFDGGILKLKI